MVKVGVAITGTLSESRKVVARLIDSSANGEYHDSVKISTHYLVATLLDSGKVREAAARGTTIISEEELRKYIAEGYFPPTVRPDRPRHYPINFPEVVWDTVGSTAETWVMGYTDSSGRFSIRTVSITGFGHTAADPSVRWIGAYDGPSFKTFRRDRVVFLCEPERIHDVRFVQA